MYAFIEGQVVEKTNNTLVLLAGGVGYLLNCSMSTISAAPKTGDTMRCHTWLSVREDAMELFGFASKEEKQLFLLLTGVTGVGPKMALALLSTLSASDLRLAMTGSIRQYFDEHPEHFDPRQYLKPARENIKQLVKHKIVDVLGCNDKA